MQVVVGQPDAALPWLGAIQGESPMFDEPVLYSAPNNMFPIKAESRTRNGLRDQAPAIIPTMSGTGSSFAERHISRLRSGY